MQSYLFLSFSLKDILKAHQNSMCSYFLVARKNQM